MKFLTRLVLVVLAPLVVAACTSNLGGGLFARSLDTRPGVVDSATAARIISNYRAARGLGPVTINATLTTLAADQARRMARADTMSHKLPGQVSFKRRIALGGYEATYVAENLGAGYQSLESAIQRWQASPSHDENLLLPQIKEIGIAVALVPNSRFKSYWALVLADPYKGGAGLIAR
ncbi:MAG: CAP domain-containing protein [Alphaproteobacteria bacterium]